MRAVASQGYTGAYGNYATPSTLIPAATAGIPTTYAAPIAASAYVQQPVTPAMPSAMPVPITGYGGMQIRGGSGRFSVAPASPMVQHRSSGGSGRFSVAPMSPRVHAQRIPQQMPPMHCTLPSAIAPTMQGAQTVQPRVVEPVFMQPQRPQQPPRDVFVDRPFPVPQPFPVQMPQPGQITETFQGFVPREEHHFPYHDPAYGLGWRGHYPDSVDQHWIEQTGMFVHTPFQALIERREEETWRDLWEEAHMGVSEHGWRHRPLPFSRRVKDPERLVPRQRDFYSELLL